MTVVAVRVGAGPMSLKQVEPACCDSTRMAVASGALFVQVKVQLGWTKWLSPEGSWAQPEAPESVVTVISLEYGDSPAPV